MVGEILLPGSRIVSPSKVSWLLWENESMESLVSSEKGMVNAALTSR